MSVFDGDIDFNTVYMVDFHKKNKIKSPRRKAIDDNCLIAGIRRDAVTTDERPSPSPDVLCPLNKEFYKETVKRLEDENPKLKNIISGEIDPTPVTHEIQDLKRTEYLVRYCSRELPFMSVNLARRARALQTLRLPDHVFIPDTSQRGSYRPPPPEKFKDHPSLMSMRPKYDVSLKNELRQILRVSTGETSYNNFHGLLGQVILEENPFGPPREEPEYGRWLTPLDYTYRI